MAQAIAHAQAHRQQYMAGFHELLRIPSVSTDPAHREDIARCASWLVEEMERIGLHHCRQIATDGHPVVYGEWLEAGAERPTVVIYAHYDVQPVDPLELWLSPPFQPTSRDGKLYARGSTDDKCGIWANLKAIESMLAVNGRLPVNVKLFFEGEEEMASPHMAPFVAAHKELLAADALLLCDGPFNPEQPTINYALRGIVTGEVRVSGPDHDLHSGKYGGTVHNPIHVVGQIAGSFHDEVGRVQIAGFYDRVRSLDAAELVAMEEAWEIKGPKTRADAGVEQFWGEEIASFPVRQTALPTLDVNGIWGGYQGPGVKTVLPAEAGFKATMRLVADQNPEEIARLFEAHVMGFARDTVAIEVEAKAEGWPVTMPFDGPLAEAVRGALAATTGKEVLMVRGGGSIPIASAFQQELGIAMSMLGFGSGDNAHAPNEYLNEADFYMGIDTAIHCYHNLAQAS
jgi:acetylornithine deacetylase/succinyl-diaminopimelate desuccinylase-like protein